MLIVDSHLDLSMNALQWNRDLLASAYTIRAQENYTPGKGRGVGTVAFPEMRRGRIALAFATLIARSTGRPVPHIDYPTPAQAYGIAKGQLAFYRALERQGHIRIIDDAARLEAHIAEWAAWDAAHPGDAPEPTPPLGFVIAMEGADPILEPAQLEEWERGGLRLLGPTHYGPGRYAGGTGTEEGLTELGAPLLAEMARCGVILDLTHCSDQAFWAALERYSGPVHASHNNCRALVPHQRQFSDEQISAIVKRGGVIGVAMDCWMIVPGWRHGDDNRRVTLADVVHHIDHICQLAGSCAHAAIGTDLDGGFGREGSPHDLDTIADLQRLVGLLERQGYPPRDIEAIMHGNWLRFLRDAWRHRPGPAAVSPAKTVSTRG
ncbi:MAG TPA: membrane dipeptidase [bacterium]|nr:membrane dipeptidase [bacterium]